MISLWHYAPSIDTRWIFLSGMWKKISCYVERILFLMQLAILDPFLNVKNISGVLKSGLPVIRIYHGSLILNTE